MTTATATPVYRRTLSPEKLELARVLHARRLTYARIGEILGDVDPSTVWAALNPEKYRQRQADRKARMEQERNRPRKVGHQFPWEGVSDEEYRG